MVANKLADRVRANSRSRSPVQDTVEKLFDEIDEAVRSGASYRKIHAQLSREQHFVGKHHSSLVDAYKKVRARRQSSSAKPMPPSQAAAPVADVVGPTAIIDTRRIRAL